MWFAGFLALGNRIILGKAKSVSDGSEQENAGEKDEAEDE